MKLKVEEIHSLNYTLFEELEHSRLVEFTQQHIRPSSFISLFYWLSNLCVIMLLGYFLFLQGDELLLQAIGKLGLGFLLFFFILLPLHELIHGVVYQLIGARNVTYKADWKKLVFYAAANHFVVNSKEFYWIAVSPFLIITLLLILCMTGFGWPDNYIFLGALVLHTGGCAGDFALMNFLYKHRRKRLVTYDDMQHAKSYFYSKA